MARSGRQNTTNIKKSLIKQLEIKGLDTPYNRDQIDAYMDMRKYREDLRKDISENGVIDRYLNNDGYSRCEVNKSVERLAMLTTRMQRLLNQIGIDIPSSDEDDDM